MEKIPLSKDGWRKNGRQTLYDTYQGLFVENNALKRNAWVAATLKNLPSGLRILDAGAGEQQYRQFCGHLEYVSQDFSQYDGQGDQKGLQQGSWDTSKIDIVSDIIAIPVEDASFDVILCTEVLEHLPAPHKAIEEFSRILKPGGKVVLTAPFGSYTHFAPYHYASGFNRYYYEQILPEYGFEITEITHNGNYFDFFAQEIHRLPEMVEKYAGQELGIIEYKLLQRLLKRLGKASEADTGSQEMMTFGFHVVARKEVKS